MTTSAAVEYTALIPAKPPHVGKQRLVGMPPAFRSALATAFALDTIAAVHSCPVVREAWLVCSDPALGAAAARLGVPTVADPEPASGDFNEVLRTVVAGLRLAGAAAVVVVPADLPALTPADLEEVLRPWDGVRPAFVEDAKGGGTTLYVARARDFDPHYGPGSREAHLVAGASELPVWLGSVQRDVDDAGDLDAAIALGVGKQTRTVLARLGLGR
jgi:2-phospho-L-lactate/phosphoenolpyruvate guanylyltransferase